MALFAKLNNQKDVSAFCNAATKMHSKVTITALNSVVDARSIMGIMTLNLSEPVVLDVDDVAEAKEAFAEWFTE